MPLFSLSTSSSKFNNYGRADFYTRFRWRIFSIFLWTIGFLIFIDVAVGFVFRIPSDSRYQPSSLQKYFSFGQSIEGKLKGYIGLNPEQDAAIMKAGWLANTCDISTKIFPGKIVFDIYGMSFSNQIADHMEQLSPNVLGHRFSGPAASPNHSYACFIRRDQSGQDRAPIQILGILASSIRRMNTISGLTTSFEAPMPFTYPRYSLGTDGKLIGHFPSIMSQNDLREALSDSVKWNLFTNELYKNDDFYNARIMQADLFDHSVIGRLVRRAWGQNVVGELTGKLHAKDGFNGAPDIEKILRAITLDFVNVAHKRGERSIIILIEDRSFGGSLSTMLTPFLKKNLIEYLSTSDVVSSEDSANFLGDGHFTPEVNNKIARAVLKIISSK